MRPAFVLASACLLWVTVLVVAVLQWTGRWRSWADRRGSPGYALVNTVFGVSPLAPALLAVNVPIMFAGFGISTFLHFDAGTYITAALSLCLVATAIYIYLLQPRWAIPPWLRHRSNQEAE